MKKLLHCGYKFCSGFRVISSSWMQIRNSLRYACLANDSISVADCLFLLQSGNVPSYQRWYLGYFVLKCPAKYECVVSKVTAAAVGSEKGAHGSGGLEYVYEFWPVDKNGNNFLEKLSNWELPFILIYHIRLKRGFNKLCKFLREVPDIYFH